MTWTNGEHSLTVITGANLAALVILAVAAASASRSHVPADIAENPRSPESAQGGDDMQDAESGDGRDDNADGADSDTIAAVQALMDDKRAYRDVDLNLNRLARKLGIPTRRISAAINRATGKNVSQYVNEYRIAEACGLLAETDKPVTEIMFEVGFQTKSNFNREFRRVTEMTPLAWREHKARTS
jgi:AraC-like DNA-binding protein